MRATHTHQRRLILPPVLRGPLRISTELPRAVERAPAEPSNIVSACALWIALCTVLYLISHHALGAMPNNPVSAESPVRGTIASVHQTRLPATAPSPVPNTSSSPELKPLARSKNSTVFAAGTEVYRDDTTDAPADTDLEHSKDVPAPIEERARITTRPAEPEDSNEEVEAPLPPKDRNARLTIETASSMPSCEAAFENSTSEIEMGASSPADIPKADYAERLNSDAILRRCGVPTTTEVDICIAVQLGKIHGSTIHTLPRNPDAESCILAGLRKVAFPSHPKMDLVRSHFSAR